MWVWVLFIAFIILCLALDLGVFNKEDHVIKTKEAAKWTSVWVGLALLFAGVVWWLFDSGEVANPTNMSPNNAVLAYLAGYLTELSLSIDNVFVIAVIFSSFKIPAKYQHRVLFWGILGAIVFRALMIVFGIALISKFDWMVYVFGLFLLYTSYSMLKNDDEVDPKNSWFYKKLSKLFPITNEISGHDFFIVRNSKKYATPLFMALMVIELTDILFALDSIPAVLAITTDEFIVFSSNILAILGLRSMFFLIVGMLEKFRFINYSLVAILAFVGLKFLFVHYLESLGYHIPHWVSLLVIGVSLAAGILASLLIKPAKEDEKDLKKYGDEQEEAFRKLDDEEKSR
ncbi:MAG TPA: TerC family protein [Flavobacteriaceae bacterium]|nr:TerC family protein [Flavobacteriaceae bacterium]